MTLRMINVKLTRLFYCFLENFLPKVDGVTRTLARLLEHLNAEGHEAIVFGPETGIRQYAGHAVVGTFGVPLVVYPGLKLNFMRPRFVRRLQQFKPDVIHFVDPIWLGAQMLPAVQKWLPHVPCVSSYHTNLPTYATLFGMPWLEETMWNLTRSLHKRCEMVFCPSESTRRMLRGKGFENVEIWSRGVDTTMFGPFARDDNLRASWGCTPNPATIQQSEQIALAQLASKLGIQVSPRGSTAMYRKRSLMNSSSSSSPDDESFIRTPPTGPSLTASPELSPPPSYDSLSGVPELPGAAFELPPPALPTNTEPQTSKTVILYVGRISWEKNIRLLIESFRALPAPVRANAKLVIVGDGPARADLTRLCQKYKLDATFMGHQKGQRLASMYASSSLMAFPSFTETFGQVVLEALASGLPVVGLHAEGTSDLVSHGITGLLLDVKASSTPSSPNNSPKKNRLAALRGESNTNKSFESTNTTNGLPVPIPSVGEFAFAMQPNTPAFESCTREYSLLLERLIRDRSLRTSMGQRAQIQASKKTWWDAMDAVVRGYEKVIQQRGISNLSDEELEALRKEQQKVAPLTGPIVKVCVVLYLVLFIALWLSILRD